MDSRSELAPERALLTPVWVAALALLIINDHALKGSGLLPGFVTGKLSDFAGLLVAPVLLASLVRAGSERGLFACHLAVGLVFAAIQISIPFADLWSGAMGLLGHRWTITSDPTDLLALPMLWVSWQVFLPAMAHAVPLAADLRRISVATLGTVGLWSSVATSDIDGGVDPEDVWYEDVYGELYINNANDEDISLFVRPLRSDIEVDCAVVMTNPGYLLPSNAFGEAVHWVLPPRTNLAITGQGSLCSAVWVGGEGVAPTVFAWTDPEVAWFPGQTFAGETLEPQGTALSFGENGSTWIGGDSFRFAPNSTAPEQPEECELVDDRVDWDLGIPGGRPFEIVALDYGPDGCFELQLADLWAEATATYYICAPDGALPFAIGDRIGFTPEQSLSVQRRLAVERLDPITNTVALAADGEPELRVDLVRGGSEWLADFTALLPDNAVTVIPRPSCEWTVDDACALDERPIELAISGVGDTLAAGDPSVVLPATNPARERELMLVHASERALIDPACADGSDLLSADLDFVVISRVTE